MRGVWGREGHYRERNNTHEDGVHVWGVITIRGCVGNSSECVYVCVLELKFS